MTTVETKRRSPVLTVTAVIVLGLVAVFAIRAFTRETVEVRVSPVTHENLVSSVPTNGKVEPVEEFQAHAPAPSVVQRVFVDIGQKVRAGELLLKLDDADVVARIASATATLRAAEASASDLHQGGTLEERNSISKRPRPRPPPAGSRQKRILPPSAPSRPRAPPPPPRSPPPRAVSSPPTAPFRPHSFDKANATAPPTSTGTARSSPTLDRPSPPRSLTTPNTTSARPSPGPSTPSPSAPTTSFPRAKTSSISPISTASASAPTSTSPRSASSLAGQAVRIVWDAKPNQVWHGHIEVAPTTVITYGTRNVGECIITVDDAHGDLLPNTNVTVTVTTSQRFNVLSVPREALHTESNSNFVYRVVGRKLVRTPVQVGLVNLTRVEITGGLTDKDTVALTATSNRDLANGMQVSTVE